MMDPKAEEDLREAIQKLERPRSTNPRKPRDCTRHEYMLTDHCYWCGTPMPGNEGVKSW